MSKCRFFISSEPDSFVMPLNFHELEPYEKVVNGKVVKDVRFVERVVTDVHKGLVPSDFAVENLLAANVPMDESNLMSNSFDVVDKL